MNKRIDLLNRESFVENVIKVVNQLSEIRRGCCFAIEGGWGIGKTFVIENIEEKLKVVQSEETSSERYFVFHYNCWQHDYYEEPAVAIISAMLASIKEDGALLNEEADNLVKAGYKFAKEKIKEIAGLYIENRIGINLISWADDVKDNKDKTESTEWEFDKMFNFSQTIEKVRRKLQEIAKERTIVLFVDELDRCIPQYAIKVLERLHHIFYGLDNVVVVMAIDRKQLEHSVEEMFGIKKDESSIDIEKYLKKFIDFSLELNNGLTNELYWEKYNFYFDKFVICGEYDKVTKVLQKLFEEVDIRRQEKIIEKANMVHSLVCNDKLDISVLIFEVMYEVLKLWGVESFQYIPELNEYYYEEIEKQIGKYKTDFLKEVFKQAYDIHIKRDDRHKNYHMDKKSAVLDVLFGKRIEGDGRPETEKVIQNNLYGKIFWYFAKIFTKRYGLYILSDKNTGGLGRELEAAKKYYEFCEIVK